MGDESESELCSGSRGLGDCLGLEKEQEGEVQGPPEGFGSHMKSNVERGVHVSEG